jgi:hypothetical protein
MTGGKRLCLFSDRDTKYVQRHLGRIALPNFASGANLRHDSQILCGCLQEPRRCAKLPYLSFALFTALPRRK